MRRKGTFKGRTVHEPVWYSLQDRQWYNLLRAKEAHLRSGPSVSQESRLKLFGHLWPHQHEKLQRQLSQNRLKELMSMPHSNLKRRLLFGTTHS